MADPTLNEQQQRANAWALMQADLVLRTRQARWETPKALAMILLAAAAISAAGGLAGHLWPAAPQQITVHFDQPPVTK
jgi:hypothetical protein